MGRAVTPLSATWLRGFESYRFHQFHNQKRPATVINQIKDCTMSAYQEAKNNHQEAVAKLAAMANTVGQSFAAAICSCPPDNGGEESNAKPLDADVVMYLRDQTRAIQEVTEQLERYCADCRL
jgi:hypothetical protein